MTTEGLVQNVFVVVDTQINTYDKMTHIHTVQCQFPACDIVL